MNCPECGAYIDVSCPPPYCCGCGWNSGYAPPTALIPVAVVVAPAQGATAH